MRPCDRPWPGRGSPLRTKRFTVDPAYRLFGRRASHPASPLVHSKCTKSYLGQRKTFVSVALLLYLLMSIGIRSE
jgi:hypothetical protein